MEIYDIEMIRKFYSNYSNKVNNVKQKLNRALTLSEKILYAHLYKTVIFHQMKIVAVTVEKYL